MIDLRLSGFVRVAGGILITTNIYINIENRLQELELKMQQLREDLCTLQKSMGSKAQYQPINENEAGQKY